MLFKATSLQSFMMVSIDKFWTYMPLPELMSLTHFEGHLKVKKEKKKTFTDLNRRVPDHLLILPFFYGLCLKL